MKDVNELADKHWSYVEQMLKAHGEDEDIIRVIGFHYKTAMVHGFKHGREDTQNGKSI